MYMFVLEFQKRMTVHKQQIKDPSTMKISLSEHFSNFAKTKDKYFSLFTFYKCPDDAAEQHRLVKETEFINKY